MPAVINLTCAVLDESLQRLRGADATPALREPKRVWSYARLHEEVCRVQGALLQQGLQPGERVVVLMHEGMDAAAAILGTIRAGLCAVPLPDTLRPRELLEVLLDCAATVVLCHADLAEALAEVRSGAPALRSVLSVGGARPGQIDFSALCWSAEPGREPGPMRDGAPAFLIYHTSPDGRLRAHAYPHDLPLLAYAAYAEQVLELSPDDRVFSTLRLASGAGLGMNLLYPLRAGAMSFLLTDQVRSRAVFDVLGSFQPTLFCATPTIYSHLVHEYLEMSAPRPIYFRSVRLCLSLGEALPRTVERRLRGVFQIDPLHGFVTSAGFHAVLSNRGDDRKPGSCGKPVAGIEARVLSALGQVAPPAEIGQLELRGRQLGAGLWCGVTQHMLEPPAEQAGRGWLTLPDRFFVDEEGYFFYVGRADDMFKVAGQLVSPLEIEQVLLGHPAVWQCAVTDDEDEDGLLLPKAHVVLNLGREPSSKLAREIIDFVKQQVSPHKVPRAVEFLQQLPRSPEGTVSRWRLKSRPPAAPLSPPSGLTPIRRG